MSDARALPHDFTAEEWVLSSLLLDHRHLSEVAAMLQAGDFMDPKHAEIFRAMLALRSINRPPTPELLSEYMRTMDGKFDAAHLFRLAAFAPHAGHCRHYAEIVARHALSRSVIAGCTKLLAEAYEGDSQPESLVRKMATEAASLAARGREYTAPVRLSDAAAEVVRCIQSQEAMDATNRAWWGLFSVDNRLGPLMPGEVAIVAARPGMGKTAWGFQMLRHSAEEGRPSMLVSLEMGQAEIATRDLSHLSEVDSRRIRRNELSDADRLAITNAQKEIGDLPLWVWAPSIATLPEIRGVLANAIERHGIRLACIDYLSLIEVEGHQRKEMRHLQVAAISRGLKRLAKELQIPLVVLQQLNREADNAEPKLSNLRESGSVEQDADIVMFIHHGTELVDRKQVPMPPNERLLLVPKFRAGPMGKIKVQWEARHTRFSDQPVAECANFEKRFSDWNERDTAGSF